MSLFVQSCLLHQERLSNKELQLAFEKSRKRHTITPQDLQLTERVQLWICVVSIILPESVGARLSARSLRSSLALTTIQSFQIADRCLMYDNSRCTVCCDIQVQEKASGRVAGFELRWDGGAWAVRQRCAWHSVAVQEGRLLSSARNLLGGVSKTDEKAVLPVEPGWLVPVDLGQSTWG
jgi:hypothetical protein